MGGHKPGVGNEGFGEMGKGGVLGLVSPNLHTKSCLYE